MYEVTVTRAVIRRAVRKFEFAREQNLRSSSKKAIRLLETTPTTVPQHQNAGAIVKRSVLTDTVANSNSDFRVRRILRCEARIDRPREHLARGVGVEHANHVVGRTLAPVGLVRRHELEVVAHVLRAVGDAEWHAADLAHLRFGRIVRHAVAVRVVVLKVVRRQRLEIGCVAAQHNER